VAGTHFAVAAFTNLTQDHLDFHATMEEYFRAKASLFTSDYAADAVICVDDEYGRRLAREVQIPAATLSARTQADWWLSGSRSLASGSTAVIHAPDGAEAELRVALPGRYNLANALVAVATAVHGGMELAAAVSGVASCPGVPGRMERVDVGQAFSAVVDYAHTPDAVERVLAELRALTAGRIITVLGCGGDRDPGKRPLMGRAAGEASDMVILTNDNPRSEDPAAIIAAMESGMHSTPASIAIEADRREAIALAVAQAQPGDIVLIPGKGHEQGQEIAGTVYPFDDRDEVRAAIAESLR
jgi:UDP-N-acetylmuramoyl-L-alanyl-D-glutamate--2,6-diaminopimelate ligase